MDRDIDIQKRFKNLLKTNVNQENEADNIKYKSTQAEDDFEFGDDILNDLDPLVAVFVGSQASEIDNQVSDLISQVKDQVFLEEKYQKHDIESQMASWQARLQGLASFRPTPTVSQKKPDKEPTISKQVPVHISDLDSTQDYQFCSICSEEPTVKCPECDNDVYCKKCFYGYHSSTGDYETSLHKPVTLK